MLALRFIPRLEKITHQIGLYLQKSGRKHPLTQSEAHILAYIVKTGPCTIRELHQSFGHRPSTLTSTLDRLEKRRLIVRRLHPEDRRAFVIRLTKKGQTLAFRVHDTLEALETRATKRLKKKEREGFLAVVDALETASQKDPVSRKTRRRKKIRHR